MKDTEVFLPTRAPQASPLKPVAAVTLFFVFSFLMNDIMGGVAMYRMPKPAYGWPRRTDLPNPVLPDIGYDILPDYCSPSNLPTLFLLFIMGITAFVFLLLDSRRVTIFCRFFLVDAVLLSFRCITIVATSLNNPSPACYNCGQDACPPTLMGCILLTLSKFPFFSCGDLMFSGHTVHFTLCALTWQYYANNPEYNNNSKLYVRSLQVIMWVLSICGICTLLMCKFHYSIDVLIALPLTLFVWARYHNAATKVLAAASKDDQHKTNKSILRRFVAWFERNLHPELAVF
eukprot:TRINITY_DN14584_c0_g1_i1.p1 TRINITY_DN14584_c0_g1~~TRINITY_DN14584_c0_g1_i1.p1  ORF type:complete len:288 (-),score=42.09 TRINITY_DN14584_c0_g1_i1:77-940(-)